MRITTSSTSDTITLTLTGRLDFNARHVFKPAVKESLNANKRYIDLDLQAVTFVDSAGLGLLHRCITDSAELKAKVRLVNPQYQVRDILELCNMDKHIATPTTTSY